MLKSSMKDLLQHIAQVEQVSRSKSYAEELHEIDTLLVTKFTMINKAVYVTGCILNGEEIKRRPELENSIREQRTSLTTEVSDWAKENKPKMSTKSGKKREPREGKGPRKPRVAKDKAVKGETYGKTYALVNAGKDIATIAAERSLTESTIESHVAKGIAEGAVEIGSLMDEPTRDTIAGYITSNPEVGSGDVFGHFAGKYSYGKLRMVQAWLRVRDKEG